MVFVDETYDMIINTQVICMEPTNSPAQRPTQTQEKFGFFYGPRFLTTANNFLWVGIDFMWETDYKDPNPRQVLREHASVFLAVSRGLESKNGVALWRR